MALAGGDETFNGGREKSRKKRIEVRASVQWKRLDKKFADICQMQRALNCQHLWAQHTTTCSRSLSNNAAMSLVTIFTFYASTSFREPTQRR